MIEYLRTPPSIELLHALLKKPGLTATELIRKNESLFQELALESADNTGLLEAMAKHPVLIERPIVVCGEKVVIGRPPEKVKDLLPGSDSFQHRLL